MSAEEGLLNTRKIKKSRSKADQYKMRPRKLAVFKQLISRRIHRQSRNCSRFEKLDDDCPAWIPDPEVSYYTTDTDDSSYTSSFEARSYYASSSSMGESEECLVEDDASRVCFAESDIDEIESDAEESLYALESCMEDSDTDYADDDSRTKENDWCSSSCTSDESVDSADDSSQGSLNDIVESRPEACWLDAPFDPVFPDCTPELESFPTTTMPPEKPASSDILVSVLLVNPEKHIFELVELHCRSATNTVNRILKMISSKASEPGLSSQQYVGLLDPQSNKLIKNSDLKERRLEQSQGKVLVAIPAGFTKKDVSFFCIQALESPALQEDLVKHLFPEEVQNLERSPTGDDVRVEPTSSENETGKSEIKASVLLLDPQYRMYELINVNLDLRTASVKSLLNEIEVRSSRPELACIGYASLCVDGNIVTDENLEASCHRKVLVAIPQGYSTETMLVCAHQVLTTRKMSSLLHELDLEPPKSLEINNDPLPFYGEHEHISFPLDNEMKTWPTRTLADTLPTRNSPSPAVSVARAKRRAAAQHQVITLKAALPLLTAMVLIYELDPSCCTSGQEVLQSALGRSGFIRFVELFAGMVLAQKQMQLVTKRRRAQTRPTQVDRDGFPLSPLVDSDGFPLLPVL